MDNKSVKCKDRRKTSATKIQERRRASERERVSDDESATERQAGEQAAQRILQCFRDVKLIKLLFQKVRIVQLAPCSSLFRQIDTVLLFQIVQSCGGWQRDRISSSGGQRQQQQQRRRFANVCAKLIDF